MHSNVCPPVMGAGTSSQFSQIDVLKAATEDLLRIFQMKVRACVCARARVCIPFCGL